MRDLSTVSLLRMSFGMTVYHHLVVIVNLIENERVMYWSYDSSLLCWDLVRPDAVAIILIFHLIMCGFNSSTNTADDDVNEHMEYI